jgi:hypothetical protein
MTPCHFLSFKLSTDKTCYSWRVDVQELRKLCERNFSRLPCCKNDAAGQVARFETLLRIIAEKSAKSDEQLLLIASLAALKQKFQMSDYQALRALARYAPSSR